MASDYYQTLGVPKNASADEIRKAYRELARKHHPDLNPDDKSAKQKFQEVQQAFDVLNDPKKREQYDRFGPAFESVGAGGPFGGGGRGPRRGGPGPNVEFDLGDLFGQGGGLGDIFRHFGGAGAPTGRATPRRGEDLLADVTVPFTTAVTGGETTLSITRGANRNETITVKIPVGIESGKKIRLREQGNPSPTGGPAGDLLLTVTVAPHPTYRRSGDRLEVTVPITLDEALEGAKIEVPTPYGSATVSVPAGAQSGQRLRLKGQGVRPKGAPAGDLLVELQVVLPEGLTDAERQTLIDLSKRRPQHPRAALRW